MDTYSLKSQQNTKSLTQNLSTGACCGSSDRGCSSGGRTWNHSGQAETLGNSPEKDEVSYGLRRWLKLEPKQEPWSSLGKAKGKALASKAAKAVL